MAEDQATADWIAKQEEAMAEGRRITQSASNEALDYVQDVIENLNDKQWRKMSLESQAVETGIGQALAEHLVPVIYKDMEKSLHKKLKVNKQTAESLRHIYMGRVIKNIRKELNRNE